MLKNKNNLILIISITILAIAVIIVWNGKGINLQKPYYAVYLRTGDMYFGHLSRCPHLTLTNVYFLQQTQSQGKVGLSLQQLKKAAFAPQDKIELNRANVVWIAQLQPDSQVVKYIEGKLPLTTPRVTSQSSPQIPSSTGLPKK